MKQFAAALNIRSSMCCWFLWLESALSKIWIQMQNFSKGYEIFFDNCMSNFRIFRMIFLKTVHCVARIGALWMQIWHSWSGFSKKHVFHFCTFTIHQNGKTNENNYNNFHILHFCQLQLIYLEYIWLSSLLCFAQWDHSLAIIKN